MSTKKNEPLKVTSAVASGITSVALQITGMAVGQQV